MTNRFNMAEYDVGTYFGINSYVEETKKVDEQRVLEQNLNDDLMPGTYSKDEVRQRNGTEIIERRLKDLFYYSL